MRTSKVNIIIIIIFFFFGHWLGLAEVVEGKAVRLYAARKRNCHSYQPDGRH